MTINAQYRYEIKFPELSKNESLVDYSKRMDLIKELSLPVIISKLKLIYCWFDEDMTFNDFLKLFDLTDKEYIDKITNKLHKIFEVIFNGSAEKN